MIKRVNIKNFKMFKEESFDLEEAIVLAGPNNSGKSTLLQAIATWNLALRRWIEVKSRSSAKKYKGVRITRKDFSAIPVRDFNLLWTDRSAHLTKAEGKQGSPRLIEIELTGSVFSEKNNEEHEWSSSINLRYDNSEVIYAYPEIDVKTDESIPRGAEETNIVHVPCFSGIGNDETRYDRGWQDKLIGEGKPGDILRNLILEIYEKGKDRGWRELVEIIKDLFNITLLPPDYSPTTTPTIICEYLDGIPRGKGFDGLSRLDIASAGSGFHQVLLLFTFFLARPSSVLLLDEPDAHLHVILQRNVFDALKNLAHRKRCQLIVATHSEVLIDSSSPSRIISFLPKPHRLVEEVERDQVREALKLVSSTELMLAEQSRMVLYLENDTDFKILREFAILLKHPARAFFKRGFFHPNQGSHPRASKAHYFALHAINEEIKGLLILDRDNRNLPDHEVSAEGLEILRWNRYEIENYLLVPNALIRFCASYGDAAEKDNGQVTIHKTIFSSKAEEFINGQFAPDAVHNPLDDVAFLVTTRASKDVLPILFNKVDVEIVKNDYFKIVPYFKTDEVHPEVIEKLDKIKDLFGNGGNNKS
jgi:predicted ATPase